MMNLLEYKKNWRMNYRNAWYTLRGVTWGSPHWLCLLQVREKMTLYWQHHSKEASVEEMMLDTNALQLTKHDKTEVLGILPNIEVRKRICTVRQGEKRGHSYKWHAMVYVCCLFATHFEQYVQAGHVQVVHVCVCTCLSHASRTRWCWSWLQGLAASLETLQTKPSWWLWLSSWRLSWKPTLRQTVRLSMKEKFLH